MSEVGTGGNGGVGQGPTFHVGTANITMKDPSTGSSVVPGSSAQV
jgi:hypothetical protein